MTDQMRGSNPEEYRGKIVVPGDDQPHQVTLLVDRERQAVTMRFDTAVAGAGEWAGSSVRVVRRKKYLEIQFRTKGLPKEAVELVWKCNADFNDGTLAGVVVARPNELRITGEKGFTLTRAA